VRSPQKVTLLSLFQSNRQLVVYADEKLTAFVELHATIHRRFEAQLESHA
jgi:hypothetical protein